MKKRLLAVLLTVAMVLSLSPSAFALDGVVPGITGPALGSAHPLTKGTYYLLDENGVPETEGASAENYNVYYADGEEDVITFKDAALKTPIYIPGGTTLEFVGTNTCGSEDDKVTTCVQTMTAGDLTITGTGSFTGYSSSGDGIITAVGEGDIIITGGTITVPSIYADANSSTGSVLIQGNAKILVPKIGASENIEIFGNAEVNAVELEADQKAIMKGDSKTVINGNSSIYGHHGIEVLENAEVNATSSSVPLNAFYGPINIDSTKKVTAVTTIANGAAIAAGVKQSENATNVTIKSEVEVTGFVGIAANGKNSCIIIDGGRVTAHSQFIAIYTQCQNSGPDTRPAGTISIKNGAVVSVIGAGNATPGIATFSGDPQPINIENSTLNISNCGFGLSGSEINLKDSDVTVASTTRAFLAEPTLNYSKSVSVEVGESAEAAAAAPAEGDYYKNKYVKIIPALEYTITLKDGENETEQSVTAGEVFVLPSPTKDGYKFTGWSDGENVYAAGEEITPTGDMTLTATWQLAATPVGPAAKVSYRVEHYKEQLDGSYVLADTDFPLFEKVGTEVQAVPKTYENYTEDAQNADRVAAGTVTKPEYRDGQMENVLVLKLYYKLDTHAVQYDLNGGTAAAGTDYSETAVKHGAEVVLKAAPEKAGNVFLGWKAGDELYPVGSSVVCGGDMTFTAQWKEIDQWMENTDLDVSVDVKVNVDVAVETGVTADVSDESQDTLAQSALEQLHAVLEGETPDGITEDQAQDLRQLLNSGASQVEAKLTVKAQLKGAPTQEEQDAVAGQLSSGEEIQVWDLSVDLAVAAKDETGAALGSVDNTPITKTDKPISFTLTTGENYSGKTVRVLYIHQGEVKTAQSVVTNAAGGEVTIQASEFSPYLILSKTYSSGGHGHGGSGASSCSVTIADKAPTGGTVSASTASAAKGTIVTITATPKDGYHLDKLTVTDKNGSAVSVTDKGSGKYTFTMPASNVTVKAAFAQDSTAGNGGYADCPKDKTCPIWKYSDAQPTAWYHDGVHFCLDEGLMVGYDDQTFRPDAATSRAMLMTILARMDGQDVTGGATWYEKAMAWAKQTGVSDGTMPEKNITREQLATMLYSYAKLKGMNTIPNGMALSKFSDSDSISGWAGDAVSWAAYSGIISGRSNGTVDPQAGATRAEMAVMLQQFVKLMEK